MKQYEELLTSLQNLGKDPSRLIFEDELTGIHNRRFLLNYLEHKVAWNVLETHPLSLIMVDLDKLKSINDTHGHQAGDQAIAEIARLIKDVTGPGGLPVRYAGDEFVILMPDTEKGEAVQVAERVLERVREEPMHLSGEAVNLPLTISLGVATAPADATTAKGLIHKADTALYHAKQSGRDRVANAAEIELQEVFGKSAIHQLEGADIIGRRSQLAEAAEAFEKFKHRQSQFLIVEGAAGMGKTTFLDTLRRTLVKSDIKLVKVNGIQQEGFRPYYLMTNLMIGLLNQLEDKGADAFASLGSREVAYLANILPQIQTSQTVELKEDEAVQREGIFTTLVQIVPKLLGAHSLVMLIDDLQYADEATLQLLRRLILRRQVPILVCGTTMDAVSLKVDHQELPLQGFCSAYQGELNLKTIVLKPLTAPDIDSHLRGLFPQITVPEGFDHNLASITQGNPLFLGEVLRKLVMDQKIILSGQRWMIRRLDEGYLPKSLEEIVRQKLAALDEQSRQLLDQASTFGEDVSLSFLTGSSKEMEAKVEEFVDQAVGLGLLSSEFQLNDETIRFLGKRVLDIVYGGIQQDRKQELHEQIGTYQESLYEQKLLPSASYLAYHFKRSTNQEKARTYEKVQTTYNARVFNAEAAASYTGDELSETEYVPPLDPASLPAIPGVVRALQTAIRNIKFYPPESQTIATANQQLAEAIQQILRSNEQLQIGRDPKTLLINGQKVDVSEYKILAEALVSFLGSIELKAIAFHRGLPEQELSVLLQTVGRAKTSEIDQLFWERFSSEQKLLHINLKQVRYAKRGGTKETPATATVKQAPDQKKPDEKKQVQVTDIIPRVLSTARNVRLYPLHSQTITASIEQLAEVLQGFLGQQPSLTLARASGSLLVNGRRVDASDLGEISTGFIDFLKALGLNSLTFLRDVSAKEVSVFVSALRQTPTSGYGIDFWKEFAKGNGLSHILFDEIVYDVKVAQTLREAEMSQPAEESEEAALEAGAKERLLTEDAAEDLSDQELVEEFSKEPFDAFLEAMPNRATDLLQQGNGKRVRQMLQWLFREFSSRDIGLREKIVNVSRVTLDTVPLGFKQGLTKLLADPLFVVFTNETDPKLVGVVAGLLHRMAGNLIQFSDYLLATRIFSQLHDRYKQLEETKDLRAQKLARILDRKLELKTQKLLMDDLHSGVPARQEHAAQVLGSLGPASMSMLVDIIKQEDDIRVGQLAAGLLAEQGPRAAKALKSELVLGMTGLERARILDVVDTVTRTLNTELAYSLGDRDPDVREAAFRLAERLNDKQVVTLLVDCAKGIETALATSAIRCLGKLKPSGITEFLVSLLTSSKDKERVIACCQALGQVGDPESVDPLVGILVAKGFLFIGNKWDAEIRAAAAFALRQISDPRAAQVLVTLANDRDPRIRQIAKAYG